MGRVPRNERGKGEKGAEEAGDREAEGSFTFRPLFLSLFLFLYFRSEREAPPGGLGLLGARDLLALKIRRKNRWVKVLTPPEIEPETLARLESKQLTDCSIQEEQGIYLDDLVGKAQNDPVQIEKYLGKGSTAG